MSVLDQFKKKPFQPAKRMAIEVTGFEVAENSLDSRIIGKNIENDEPVKVFLRNIKQDQGADYARPEIVDLEKKIKVGGIVRADGAFFDDKQGAISARWIKKLTAGPDEGMVYIGTARVSPVLERKDGSGKKFQTVELLDDKAEVVTNESELKASLIASLESNVPGNPIAMLRVSNKDRSDVASFIIDAKTQGKEADYARLTGQESLDRHLSDNEAFKRRYDTVLSKVFGNTKESLRVEVVGGSRFNVGPKTMSNTFGNEFHLKKRDSEDKFAAYAHAIVGYTTVGEGENQGYVVTSAVPVNMSADLDVHGLPSKEPYKKPEAEDKAKTGATANDVDTGAKAAEDAVTAQPRTGTADRSRMSL